MQIKLDKKQYEALLKSIAVSSHIYAIMADLVDEKYQDFLSATEWLQSHLLAHAEEAKFPKNNYDLYDSELLLSDDYMDMINEEMNEFTDFEFYDNLAREMAQKDLEESHSVKELSNMPEEKYMSKMSALETKYHKEFEKHWLKNLKIK